MRYISLALLFVVVCMKKKECEASHFRGGTISWAPVNPIVSFPLPTEVEVAITTRFFWNLNTYIGLCDSSACVANATLFGDNTFITPNNGPYWSISALTNCYDFNVVDTWAAGVRTQIVNVTTSQVVSASFTSCCWIANIVSLTGLSSWNLTFFMDLRPRADNTQRINSSPTSDIVPFVKLSTDCVYNQSLVIPVSDADGDLVRCSCAGNTCLPDFAMDSDACIMYMNPVMSGYYALEVVLEDYPRGGVGGPLSSVTLQFIAYVVYFNTSFCCNFLFYKSK